MEPWEPELVRLPEGWKEKLLKAVYLCGPIIDPVQEPQPVVILDQFGRPFTEVEPAEDPVITRLLAEAHSELEIKAVIDPNDDVFKEHSIDGLEWFLFVSEVLDRHGIEIPDEELARVATISELAEIVRDKQSPEETEPTFDAPL